MMLLSSAFGNNETIPIQYSGEGKDISPPLRWQDVPEDTRSLALICDDPDAPNRTWDHWILYNIPPSIGTLAEDLKLLPQNARSGLNSWGKTGYGGPMPPRGHGPHHYFFTLYALDTVLQFPFDVTKEVLLKEMRNHTLGKAILIGLYERK
ncbi:MAG: hypothetical protein ACD_16C00137G0001 [uncultured bacterium]|nr:MAG: hypothetical protein ACD_16C00137G0001 [uncultured bacterium]OFW69014.1 MAG: hypothetical protein A2X70_02555 [Alphaproteobacteria bacterium GWC2_42_16]OFW73840.1 MAG: hypothetical protein A2Z80_04215 [Alphaproteobacteria bacterium GWA2_41_27]OFW82183.1 MAG: hypothetical protein A3E50_00255 [Alphaproteobacteria bacterium RIFCSPHIGHO2_12_FULL_42_100]OFW86366.1 MAG: hypothetical protein A2W06_02225 [Alphaproteobacteria bacterium RBG_16_42_14]OFW91278.1 MAG: hypothetical protein A3C41_064